MPTLGPTPIPEDLTDEQVLFLTDILPTSYWGVENGCVKRDDTVVVLGCGPVGLADHEMGGLQRR